MKSIKENEEKGGEADFGSGRCFLLANTKPKKEEKLATEN
jgi:hypothetical protein